MIEIERVSWRNPSYVVRGDDGHSGVWVRRRFAETMTGEIDGEPYELRRDGRRRFTLISHGCSASLPGQLSRAVQAFIGFVVLLLWDRAASSPGAAATAASG